MHSELVFLYLWFQKSLSLASHLLQRLNYDTPYVTIQWHFKFKYHLVTSASRKNDFLNLQRTKEWWINLARHQGKCEDLTAEICTKTVSVFKVQVPTYHFCIHSSRLKHISATFLLQSLNHLVQHLYTHQRFVLHQSCTFCTTNL